MILTLSFSTPRLEIVSAASCARNVLGKDLTSSATNREYGMVAKAYNALKEKGEKNVLFVRIAIDNSQRIFQYHDFKTAPIITYLPSNELMEKNVKYCLMV